MEIMFKINERALLDISLFNDHIISGLIEIPWIVDNGQSWPLNHIRKKERKNLDLWNPLKLIQQKAKEKYYFLRFS